MSFVKLFFDCRRPLGDCPPDHEPSSVFFRPDCVPSRVWCFSFDQSLLETHPQIVSYES
jgi:hypothetical protein